jgi:hypothetical protein
MKKFLVLFLAAATLLTACKKEDELSEEYLKDVVFTGVDPVGHKSSTADCNNPEATYAKVIIDGEIYTPAVFYNAGNPYTQAIKMAPGIYSLDEFVLMNDNGTPNDKTDDLIVSATPKKGSDYADFVDNPLAFDIEVGEYTTNEVDVEVICFNDSDFDKFGYNWFDLTEITVREQFIFGTICVNPEDYKSSIYEGQNSGLQMNMPAIFKVDVYKNGEMFKTYSNESWLGEGQALTVEYPDHNTQADEFEFRLHILVADGSAFNYQHFHTWTFNDDEKIDAGQDGVVDFVVGNCVLGETDLQMEWPSMITISEGWDANATSHGAVRYKSFDNSGDREVYLGTELGSGSSRVEKDLNWQANNHVVFAYNPSTGVISTTVNGNSHLEYTVEKNASWDGFKLDVAARKSAGTSVSFENVTVNGNAIGQDFIAEYSSYNTWTIDCGGMDTSEGFIIEADLNLTGEGFGGEHSKVEIAFQRLSD